MEKWKLILPQPVRHDPAKQMSDEIENNQERIRELIAERDKWQSAAEQNWKLREEFQALLGTDDVAKGAEKVRAWIEYAGRLEGAGDEMAKWFPFSSTHMKRVVGEWIEVRRAKL